MRRTAIWMQACAIAGALAGALAGTAALAADDLCGRPREEPEALLQRLTKTEKLEESFRDKAYVAFNDAVKGTLWTFTVAGHPAHPSVICRRPVEEGGKIKLEMGAQCNASEAECERLMRGFEELNQQMLKELERQEK
ncbi:MAG TPA: hypothetical protein VG758_02755 [Hyphomicrobiaceae bacterium]|nr:hypothetical protein [Hyphomicrobiaceae bacterium]